MTKNSNYKMKQNKRTWDRWYDLDELPQIYHSTFEFVSSQLDNITIDTWENLHIIEQSRLEAVAVNLYLASYKEKSS